MKIGHFSMNIFNTWFLSKVCIFLRENIKFQYHFAVQKKKQSEVIYQKLIFFFAMT